MKWKQNLLFIFLVLAGIVVGGMMASVCEKIAFLRWLSYAASIGFNPEQPFMLDLSILQLTFAFSMRISVAQIITIALAVFAYTKVRIK